MVRMLDSEEAARRLGVKVTTLYAYVSRGLLASYPSTVGRRSQFDVDEVERLARRSRQGKTVETRMATITTGITQLTDEGPLYRGRRATDLATSERYEDVADWLWDAPVLEPAPAGMADAGQGGRRRPASWVPLPLGTPPRGRVVGEDAMGRCHGRRSQPPPGGSPARGRHSDGAPGGSIPDRSAASGGRGWHRDRHPDRHRDRHREAPRSTGTGDGPTRLVGRATGPTSRGRAR